MPSSRTPAEVENAQANVQSTAKHHVSYTRLNECLDSHHTKA